jgi:hypothetical protein
MQTGSNEALTGGKSGKTAHVPLYMGPNGGSVALDSDAEWSKLDFAERDKCRPVLRRLSLARNLEKPVMSLYGTELTERNFRLLIQKGEEHQKVRCASPIDCNIAY